MTTYCTIVGLDPLTQRMRTWPQAIDAAVHARVMVEARPLVGRMRSRAAAVGGPARIAGRTVALVSARDGVAVRAGGTPVLFGAEFGSKRVRRKAYVTRSRARTPYVVRRRTTRQFRPFLGRRGYWFWPTVRSDLKGINARVGRVIAEAVD